MALITRYVNTASTAGGDGTTNATTGANRAYPSLSAAEAAEQVDLVAAGDQIEFICSGTGDTTNVTFATTGWTTGAGNTITIKPHDDDVNDTGIFDANKYHLGSPFAWTASLYDNGLGYVYVDGLQFEPTGSNSVGLRLFNPSGTYSEAVNCIFKGNGEAGQDGIVFGQTGSDCTIANNVIYDLPGIGIRGNYFRSTGDLAIYNNTVYGCGTGLSLASGAGTNHRVINNLLTNNTTDYASLHTPALTANNITSDATSPDVSLRNITVTYTNAAGDDYSTSDSDVVNVGSDLSQDELYAFNRDVKGSEKGTLWDIGAFQNVTTTQIQILGSYPQGADNGNQSTAEISVSLTPPLGTDCIVITYGGWSDDQASAIDIGGTSHTPSDVAVANGPDQVSSIFVVTTLDAAWPGVGSSVTFTTVTNAPSNDTRRMGVVFLSGVDQANPTLATDTLTAASSSTPSITLTSESNGVCIGSLACYDGDPAAVQGDETEVYAIRSGSSNVSYLSWVDPSDGSSTTLDNTLTAGSALAFTALSLRPLAPAGGGGSGSGTIAGSATTAATTTFTPGAGGPADCHVNLYNTTPASLGGTTFTNLNAVAATTAYAITDESNTLTSYTATWNQTLTLDTNGQGTGGATVALEMHREIGYISGSVFTITIGGLTDVTSLDITLYFGTGYADQTSFRVSIPGETDISGIPVSNTTSTADFTGVVPVSDEVVITVTNESPSPNFTSMNGFSLLNIAEAAANSGSGTASGSATTTGVATGGSIPVTLSDSFGGQADISDIWDTYDPRSGGLSPVRDGGYYRCDITSNPGDITTWFNDDIGRLDYQTAFFPVGATPNEYHFYGVGVCPVGANYGTPLPYSTNDFAFIAIMVHDNNLATNSYTFAAVGHRGTAAQFTIENKGTILGDSDVNDNGSNVFGAGISEGDIGVELHSNGNVLYKYRPIGGGSWTYINSGTGLVPTPPNMGSNGDSVKLGIAPYAFTTNGIPFTAYVDSFQVITEEGTYTGSGTIAGSATSTASGTKESVASGTINGVATSSANATKDSNGSGSASGNSTTSGAATKDSVGSGSVSGSATTSGDTTKESVGSGTSSGTATSSAAGTISGTVPGAGSSNGVATSAAQSTVTRVGQGSISGSSTSASQSTVSKVGSGQSDGSATSTASGTVGSAGTSSGSSTTTGDATKESVGSGTSSGSATSTADGTVTSLITYEGSGQSNGSSSSSANGELISLIVYPGSGQSDGAASVSGAANISSAGSGTSAGVATASADSPVPVSSLVITGEFQISEAHWFSLD